MLRHEIKLIVKQKFYASSWLITKINFWGVNKNVYMREREMTIIYFVFITYCLLHRCW